jgi:peptidoglycan/LPS O-acetylase OafA/YrhL
LDGVRGLAILLVLIAHVVGLNGAGLTGVLLFFVLSGYLITGLMLREQGSTGRINLGSFFVRRALRLLPALFAFLALYLVVVGMGGVETTMAEAWWGAALAATYLTDVFLSLQSGYTPDLAHLWSLAVEEHFYLFWPLVVTLTLIRRGLGGLFKATVALLVLGALLREATLIFALKVHPVFVYASPTTWIDSLFSGALLAQMEHGRRCAGLRRVAARPFAQLLALAVLLGYAVWPGADQASFTYALGIPLLNAAAVTVLCGLSETQTSSLLSPTLSQPWIRWFGRVSYGLYLYNSACIMLVRHVAGSGWVERVVGLCIAAALATASFVVVERPALRLKARLRGTRGVSSGVTHEAAGGTANLAARP